MSTKKGRGAKVLKAQQETNKSNASAESEDQPNISAIERASFFEGLQLNHGNPLHSTAIEEDLNVLVEGQAKKGNAGTKDAPQAVKTAAKKPVKDTGEENGQEEEKKNRQRRKSKARPEKGGKTYIKDGAPQRQRAEVDGGREGSDSDGDVHRGNQPTGNKHKHLVGEKPAKRKSAGQASAARTVKNEQIKNAKKRVIESESGKSSGDSQSEEESDSGVTKRRHRRVLSSDDDDLDTSWKPSPKKVKMLSLDRGKMTPSETRKFRKSSSGSTSAGAMKAGADKQKKKKRGGRSGRTDLDMALDAFVDFCEQYSESVESKAVKQSIECFSSNVKQQILEKISSNKDFKQLKRENAKVGSMIRTKTQRLLDAKYELMRVEREVWLLEKEKAKLKLRLADLRQSQAFLHEVRELNKQYRDFRRKHPTEKETYGASSLPALLLETRYVQSAEHQMNRANKQPEKRQKTSRK
ncbi:uncharacterized protein V6R79_015643 [Siganus canaliculatus]